MVEVYSVVDECADFRGQALIVRMETVLSALVERIRYTHIRGLGIWRLIFLAGRRKISAAFK